MVIRHSPIVVEIVSKCFTNALVITSHAMYHHIGIGHDQGGFEECFTLRVLPDVKAPPFLCLTFLSHDS
jgi:hypothetical protein